MENEFTISYDIDVSFLSKLQPIFDDVQKAIAEVVSTAENQLAYEWAKEADLAGIKGAGYKQAIEHYKLSDLHSIVENNHKAVWYLELGYPAFDLKKILETSTHVKTGKDGKRYIRIPFDNRVKDLVNAGIDSKDIARLKGTKIRSIINREDGSKSYDVAWGDRLKAGTVGIRSKTFPVIGDLARKTAGQKNTFTVYQAAKPAEPFSQLRYTWKSSPFQGAVKMVDFQGKTSGVKTFRTISENSDPSSWIHPGLKASHIAEKAVNTIKPQFIQQVGATLQDIFKKAGFE